MSIVFDYDAAFSRNLGLLDQAGQGRLRKARVALPGLGGVGGGHLQALARLGVGSFHLADPDRFELANFNRQLGASLATAGRSKAEVLGELAASINPEARIEVFAEGFTKENAARFLAGVSVVVDGMEFFELEIRRLLYRACRERGIPVVLAAPIGYGAAVLVFQPSGMPFEDYFRIEEGMTRAEQWAAFGLGLAPGLISDVDPAWVNLERRSGPALSATCFLCAGAAAIEVLKLLTGRGTPASAPRGIYLDPYRGRTLGLRRRPALGRGLRGRLLRHLAFRRYPGLRALHEAERATRGCRPEAPERTAAPLEGLP